MFYFYEIPTFNNIYIFFFIYRFRVFHSPISLKPDSAEAVIMCACVMHNLIRMRANLDEGEHLDEGEVTTAQSDLFPSLQLPASRTNWMARFQRDYIRDYFSSPAGSVQWQLDKI